MSRTASAISVRCSTAERVGPAPLGLHHLGVDRARAEHAHPDRQLVDGQLLGQRLGDRHDRRLGRRVGPDEGHPAEQPGDGRGVHDVGRRALLAEDRQEAVDAVDHAPEVDVDHPVPVVERLVGDQVEGGHPGVVAQHVHPAEPVQRRGREPVDIAPRRRRRHRTASASPPAEAMPAATVAAASPSRSATTTADPSAANRSASAWPMPLAAAGHHGDPARPDHVGPAISRRPARAARRSGRTHRRSRGTARCRRSRRPGRCGRG